MYIIIEPEVVWFAGGYGVGVLSMFFILWLQSVGGSGNE